jgi:addiction module RelE/StbE family toxin
VRLRYTRRALADLDDILEYIRRQSPARARQIQGRIKALTALLVLHPHIGRRTTNPVLCRLVVSPFPYLIFYQVTEKEIVIHAVRHTSRNPSGMPGS